MDKRGALVRLLVAAPLIAGTFGAGHHVLMHAVGGDAAMAPLWSAAGFDADTSGRAAAAALGARGAWWLGLLIVLPSFLLAYRLLRRGSSLFAVGFGVITLGVLMATTGAVLGLAVAMSIPGFADGAFQGPVGRASLTYLGALYGALGAVPFGLYLVWKARKLDARK